MSSGPGTAFAIVGAMFPKNRFAIYSLPLIAALSFLAHVHYTKVMHSMKFEHHSFAAAAHGR